MRAGAQSDLPPAGEDGARGVALDRAADRPTRLPDPEPVPPTSKMLSSDCQSPGLGWTRRNVFIVL